MHMHLEEPGRLKITLTDTDLRRFSLSYEQLDYSDPATRRALGALMAEASAETGFCFRPGHLLIEAFPAPAGGCLIYFTLLDQAETSAASEQARPLTLRTGRSKGQDAKGRLRLKAVGGTQYVFEFTSAGDLLAAVEQLYMRPAAAAAQTDLYLLDGRYRLLMRPRAGDRTTPMLLGEYACAAYHTPAAAAYTAEHGRLLAKGRAVRQIGQALYRS